MSTSEVVAGSTDSQSESSHTPGPWNLNWTIAGGGQHRELPTLHYVGIEAENVARPDLRISGYIAKGDAYLLAAAPDLLEAIEEVVESWDSDQYESPMGRKVREAITKATGKLR